MKAVRVWLTKHGVDCEVCCVAVLRPGVIGGFW